MRRIYLFHNRVPKTLEFKKKLIPILKKEGFILSKNNPDVIIVIGGDGTMLSAIRAMRMHDVPFLGVNTGNLGFLPGINPNNLDVLISLLKDNKFKLYRYPLLEVETTTIKGEKCIDVAFNEIMIKHNMPRLMEALVYINDKPFNYFTGDGFIISTPIGTTGYAIWAGGAAIHSSLWVFQLTPLNPNDNRINRPLKNSMIIPHDTRIDMKIVKAERRSVMVACDGLRISDDFISELSIRASEKSIQIIKPNEADYFELYRQKIIDKNIHRYLHEKEQK